MSLVELVPPFSLPFVERPVSHFIDKGEDAGYTRERERERKTRRKKASGVAALFISFTRVPLIL